MDLLEVRNLRVSFPSRHGTIHALNGVSFSLKQGDVLGIIGESGSGKSVTALAILRMIGAPGIITGGEILLDGADLLGLPPRQMRGIRGKEIFLVFQSSRSTLNPTMTMGRQIMEALTTHGGLTEDQAARRMKEILREVEIPPERAGSYPFHLSGGMQQRVLIAIALALRPRVLIADEPTTGLDTITQREILLRLGRLKDELGMAIILITHDFRVASFLADRVAVMRKGVIVECEDKSSLLSHPRDPYTIALIDGARRLASH